MADIVLTSEGGITAIVQVAQPVNVVVDGALKGDKGLQGNQGPGVPLGGNPDDVLAKNSSLNNDTKWVKSSAGSVIRTVSQTAHGFSTGQLVFWNGTAFQLSRANSPAFAEVDGMISGVTDADHFGLCMVGYLSGLPGPYTVGPRYFLSTDTPGALSLTDPSTRNPVVIGQVSKPVFVADTTNSGYFFNYRGATITGQGV